MTTATTEVYTEHIRGGAMFSCEPLLTTLSNFTNIEKYPRLSLHRIEVRNSYSEFMQIIPSYSEFGIDVFYDSPMLWHIDWTITIARRISSRFLRS